MNHIKYIESQTSGGPYGFEATKMIVEINSLRVLLVMGYGGEDTSFGGCVRWRHGVAVQLLAADTLESLSTISATFLSTGLDIALTGYDTTRPIIDQPGTWIEDMATGALKS